MHSAEYLHRELNEKELEIEKQHWLLKECKVPALVGTHYFIEQYWKNMSTLIKISLNKYEDKRGMTLSM